MQGHRTEFTAQVDVHSHQVLEDILGAWPPVEAVRVRYRVIGSEVTYEDDTVYLYAHELDEQLSFLLEGHLDQEPI